MSLTEVKKQLCSLGDPPNKPGDRKQANLLAGSLALVVLGPV